MYKVFGLVLQCTQQTFSIVTAVSVRCCVTRGSQIRDNRDVVPHGGGGLLGKR